MRRRHWLLTVPVLFVALALPANVLAASGDRDVTFHQDGMSTIFPLGPNSGSAATAVVQQNGKTIAAGSGDGANGSKIIVARFGSNGYKDGTCGGGHGFKVLDFGHNNLFRSALAVLADNKILIASDSYDSSTGHHQLVLARLQANCDRDGSFGKEGGAFISDFGFAEGASAYDLLVLPDGRIIVAGSVWAGGPENVAIWRFTADGHPDLSFGDGDGMTTFNVVADANRAERVIRLPSGELVVAGMAVPSNGGGTGSKTMFAGFKPDGSIDKAFGNLGAVTYDSTNDFVDLVGGLSTSNGKIVACLLGSGDNNDAVVLRLNANGWPDETWGGDGQVRHSYGAPIRVWDCRAQQDGKVVLAGHIDDGGNVNWFVARLAAGGGKDMTFGTNGYNTSAQHGSALAISLDKSGRIILAGDTLNGSVGAFSVARFLP